MNHYEFFSNENEILLGKLYDTYLEFFKTKKEYLESRDEFLIVLQERFPEEYRSNEEEVATSNTQETTSITQTKENKPNNNEEIHEEEIYEEEKKEVKGENNIRISALFHKIALHAHPDKHKNVNPILFDQSVKACEKGKFGKLCFLAKFMNLSFDTFTNEEIQNIKETIKKKEQKIQHYNRTYSMMYKRTNSQKTRDQLIEAFQKQK